MKTRVIVRTYSYGQNAEAARALLSANGIESFVAADDCGAQYPGLGFVRGIQLLVNTDQSSRANEVLGLANHGSAKKTSVKNQPKKPAKKRE